MSGHLHTVAYPSLTLSAHAPMLIGMDKSERIARALEEMFRCFACREWLPMSTAARDVRWDAELLVGVICQPCDGEVHREVA